MNPFSPSFVRGMAALAAWTALHTATAQADEPLAIFAGDGLEVVIESAGPQGKTLRGQLHHLGQQYPFEATTHADFGQSHGTFRVGEDAFEFELRPTGDANTLQLVTGDVDQPDAVTYDLRRQEMAAATSSPSHALDTIAQAPAEVAAEHTEHKEPEAPAAPEVPATPEAPVAPTATETPAAAPAQSVGLTLQEVFGQGWEVTTVDPGSRAQKAGFAPGDMIVAARQAGADGALIALTDQAAVVAALTQPGVYLTTSRAGRADHTVVLYSAAPSTPPVAPSTKPDAAQHASQNQATGPASATHAPHAPDATRSAPVAVPAPTGLVGFEPATVTDHAVTGLVSHQLMLPQGWSLDAKVLWSPAVDAAFVNLSARVTSPDGGQQVTWLPDGAFTDAVKADAGYGAIVDGKVRYPRLDSAADFIQTAVLPSFRPQATGVRVLSEGASQDLADAWQRNHESFLTTQKDHLSTLHAHRSGAASPQATRVRVTAPQLRLGYEEQGKAYEEAFTFVHVEMTTPVADGSVHDWFVFSVSALRAPAGELDQATPALQAAAESLVLTQRWQAVVAAMAPELTKAQPPMTPAQAKELAGPLLHDLDR